MSPPSNPPGWCVFGSKLDWQPARVKSCYFMHKGSSGPSAFHCPGKSESTKQSTATCVEGKRIIPLFFVPLRYQEILFMPFPWDALGLWVNEAHWCIALHRQFLAGNLPPKTTTYLQMKSNSTSRQTQVLPCIFQEALEKLKCGLDCNLAFPLFSTQLKHFDSACVEVFEVDSEECCVSINCISSSSLSDSSTLSICVWSGATQITSSI